MSTGEARYIFWGAAIPLPISDPRHPRHVEAVKQIEQELVEPVAGAVDVRLIRGIKTVLGMVIGGGALVAPRGLGYRAYRRLTCYWRVQTFLATIPRYKSTEVCCAPRCCFMRVR